MKLLLLVLITLSTTILASSKISEDERLCKMFNEKALEYKEKMREDAYAIQTLASYERRAKIYCERVETK